jgi:hypothetical protein
VPSLCDQSQTGHAARADQISNHCSTGSTAIAFVAASR